MKRGWCPTLHAPMLAKDGLLLRLKPPQGRLTPEAAHALADAAARHGNGIIELTQRGNLQLRGFTPLGARRFAAEMVRSGLAHPDPAVEIRRAVIPPALLGDDPALAPNADAFTAHVEAVLATDARFAGLPDKFAVAIDAGGILSGRPVAADLVAWIDGGETRPPHPGLLPPAGEGAGSGPGFGLRAADAGDAAPLAGLLPYPGTEDGAFALAPPFGQLDAALLHQAADLAAGQGTVLHVTPWRALLLGRVPRVAATALRVSAGAAWITDPIDPRLRVTACVGSPGCTHASVATRVDAARLRPAVRVHVSGCAKGCAHPAPSPFTLVGRDGLYDLVLDGRAADAPAHTALTAAQAAALLP